MTKVVTQNVYVTSNGKEFDTKEAADVHQEILDLRKELAGVKDRLADTLNSCTHPDRKLVRTLPIARATGKEDEYGKDTYKYINQEEYVCRCCGATAFRWADEETVYWDRPWIS